MSLSAPKLPTSYSNKLKEIVKRRIETFNLILETSIFCLERRQSSQQLHLAEMASTFIWARRCIPTQKESTFSDPTGSSPTCVKTAVRIRLQSARSIINHQSSMHYEIFRNLSAVFLWVLSKTVHTMEKTRLTLSASWFAMKIFQRKRKEKMMRIFESI
jgi:hypothetical protein